MQYEEDEEEGDRLQGMVTTLKERRRQEQDDQLFPDEVGWGLVGDRGVVGMRMGEGGETLGPGGAVGRRSRPPAPFKAGRLLWWGWMPKPGARLLAIYAGAALPMQCTTCHLSGGKWPRTYSADWQPLSLHSPCMAATAGCTLGGR